MLLDWEGYRKEISGRIAELGRLSPGTFKGYRELSDAGKQRDLLGPKVRELIALAVSVTRQCDGCITTHTTAALAAGATRDEIAEALGVAVAVNAGATLIFSGRVMDAIKAKSDNGRPPGG